MGRGITAYLSPYSKELQAICTKTRKENKTDSRLDKGLFNAAAICKVPVLTGQQYLQGFEQDKMNRIAKQHFQVA